MTSPPRTLILLIEDDELLRQTLVNILQLNGYAVVAAIDGQSGLEMARREEPALVITDLVMPALTGFQLLEIFAEDEALRMTPVIVITAATDRAAIRRCMELGAADYITKPCTEKELVYSVSTQLEKKERLDELDAFAHTVAHDLKNPLAALTLQLGMLRILQESSAPEAAKTQLQEAVETCGQLASSVHELLLLAKVRRKAVKSLPLDMAEIVKEAIDQVEYLVQRENARIELPATWPASVGHAPWVVHVWANYLSNAVKYGGPNPQIKLGAGAGADGRSARYWVEDQGAGLEAEAVGKLFVPFTRIGTMRASGHGLGLSIVRRIVEKLGGTVGVVTSPGAGAKFWFELPLRPPSCSSSPFQPSDPAA